jgi:hypothetical protein
MARNSLAQNPMASARIGFRPAMLLRGSASCATRCTKMESKRNENSISHHLALTTFSSHVFRNRAYFRLYSFGAWAENRIQDVGQTELFTNILGLVLQFLYNCGLAFVLSSARLKVQ